MRWPLLLPLTLLTGCGEDVAKSEPAVEADADTGTDADTDVPDEPCTPALWFLDADGDGHGDPFFAMEGCPAPPGYVDNDTDCDDTDPEAFPGQVWYGDVDGDGFGDPDLAQESCTRPEGHVAVADDCDDADSTKNPAIDWHTDADADGYGDPASTVPSCEVGALDVSNADDCDDTDPEIHPLATEVCDAYIDNDCNGLADEEDPGLELRSRVPLFRDADSDGWGSEEYVGDHCPSSGIGVEERGDCDDSDASVNPDRLELPDETDQNCDGDTYYHYVETLSEGLVRDDPSEGFGTYFWSRDLDGDADQDLLLGYPDADSERGELAWWDDTTDADLSAAAKQASWTGIAEGSRLGESAAAVGDLDDDGIEDLLVSDFGEGGEAWTVHLLSSDTPSGMLSGTTASWELDANPLGASLLAVGDIDSDGLPEAIIGQNNGTTNDVGRLYMVDADDLGTSTDPSTLSFVEGVGRRSDFGAAIDVVADADGDGVSEVIVGSRRAGQAHLLTAADFAAESASDSTTIYGDSQFGGVGEFVGGLGDLDGDGYGDFAISSYNSTAWNDVGAVHFFYGASDILDSRPISGEDARLIGQTYGESFGGINRKDFHAASDMDGDGTDDLLMAVTSRAVDGASGSGAVYGIFGRRLSGTHYAEDVADFAMRGTRPYTYLGIGVARAGDRDGDGHEDLWLGAKHSQTGDRDGTIYFFPSELIP